MQEFRQNRQLTAERQQALIAKFNGETEQEFFNSILWYISSSYANKPNIEIARKLFFAIIDIVSFLDEEERLSTLSNYKMIFEKCRNYIGLEAIENVLKYVINNFNKINNDYYATGEARKISLTFEIISNILLLTAREEKLNALNHLMHKNFGLGKPRIFNMLNDAPKALYHILKFSNYYKIYLGHPYNTSVKLSVDNVVVAPHNPPSEIWRAKEIINILVICNSINKEKPSYYHPKICYVNDPFKLAEVLYSIRTKNISLFKEIYGKWHYKNTESKLTPEAQNILIESCISNKNINSMIKSSEFFLEIESLFENKKLKLDPNCINESIMWLSKNDKDINFDTIKSKIFEKESIKERIKLVKNEDDEEELSDILEINDGKNQER